ncbi:D-lyxose/D-mannose family sugar isomerase [Propionispira arboris]|nr:D-lyxose/D-mannose family sugar isomerase [Propionispira arboris]
MIGWCGNDDRVDNRFYKAQSRIPEIEEGTSPTHLIFKDYAKYIQYI